MFLKRLEVIGFKSFADQISVEFDKGVTAVVGPNGSGKSNISDGIRWVLGEQSAKSLRGAKMEDIIFAGSDTRKPLNFAEITLVLDNNDQYINIDYTEVSVTRRVYRSGESEYLLNKQTCRLKDIVDLFLDSGLGKEAYSIIGQGKVEEILSSKGEDRRVIFEEAAGVLKYKTRKVKAVKKLTETEDNLNRVQDIIYELEGQIEPLKVQSSLAKEYLEKKEELKEIEVALIVYEITELHQMWVKEKEKLELYEKQKETLTERLDESKEKSTELRSTIRNIDETLTILQEELLRASEALEKSEGQKEVYKERKKNVTQNKDQVKKTLEELAQKKASYEITIAQEQQKYDQLKQQVSNKKEQLAHTLKKLNMLEVDLDAKLEQLKSDYIEVLNEKASVRNEHRFLDDQINSVKRKRDELLKNNEHLLHSRKDLMERKSTIEKEIQENEAYLNQKVHEFRSLQRELERDKELYQKRQTKVYDAYQMIQQVRSRKEVIEEMQADFSGFFQGVKEVLKARGSSLSGIVGAVAELVQVPKEYETAFEIALGGSAQHIVTQTEEDARRAIQFLKKNGYGRATFLPLPVIKARSLRPDQLKRIENNEAFIGVAANLIQYENKYTSVISNLLGQVIIARDLQGANQLARILGFSTRIVTLDGDVVNPGGSMTGGAIKQKGTPLLGRSRELEELSEKLKLIEGKTQELEKQLKELKTSIAEKETALETLRQMGEEARESCQKVQKVFSEIEHEEKTLNERLALFDREQSSFSREEVESEKRLQHLSTQEKELVTTEEKLEKEINEIEEKRKEQQSSKQSIQESLTEIKIDLAKEEERFHSQHETLIRLKREQEDVRIQFEDVSQQLHFLESEMNDSNSGEQTIEELIETNRQNKNSAIHKITIARKERTGFEELLKSQEENIRNLDSKLNYQLDELHKCEVQVNRYDVKLDKMLEQLQHDYELSYDLASDQFTLNLEVEEARTRVKLIKLGIDELGTVNLGAIEEYERVSERYQFLQEQRDDLTEAKETLRQVISEMDAEMTKRFQESFEAIRSHFQVVYKKLFGGGEADLILTDPLDLLETGVEILARPPGKKLQNLALLSGGERALTAIALLFAILKVRPVPFCVLDEVEAALDEANVNRFASYLREFSDETQFIVITHRKGTMEEADVLYGVTMQESGVSKLVSVRLEESKQLIES